MNVSLWICALIFAPFCTTYKILVVSPMPSKSHGILGDGYVKLLLEAGHEVTYITGVPKNNSHPLLREVDVSENEKYLPSKTLSINAILDGEFDVGDTSIFLSFLIGVCQGTLEHREVAKILQDVDQNFDLVIAEWMMDELYAGSCDNLNERLYYIMYALFYKNMTFTHVQGYTRVGETDRDGAISINGYFFTKYYPLSLIVLLFGSCGSGSVEQNFMVLKLIDEASSPAYTASIMSANKIPFTFIQRVKELFIQISIFIMKEWTMYYPNKEFYYKIFGPATAIRGRHLPSYDEARYNASLVLGNSHVSVGEANSLPQSYKAIGGYHIDPNVKPLQKELQSIMDKATNGVIYFSMGSNLNSRDIPDVLKKKLINVFSQLKQIVLWKFEEDFPNLPENVHVLKWAPQQSILVASFALFITHGGLLSTTEAVHFGVPIIGIPAFGDQHMNVQRAVNKGYAINVKLSYDMAEELETAIQEMMRNPRYRNKVKELSFIYHHRPATPQVELVHWVEHVIKTRGAPHLRSPALSVSWYQKLYLDPMALLVTMLFLIFFSLRILISLFHTTKQTHKLKTN